MGKAGEGSVHLVCAELGVPHSNHLQDVVKLALNSGRAGCCPRLEDREANQSVLSRPDSSMRDILVSVLLNPLQCCNEAERGVCRASNTEASRAGHGP